jgi:hypothetical protein
MARHGVIRYMQSDLDHISQTVLDKYGIKLPPPPKSYGFQNVATSGHHFSGTGSVPNVNHDDWDEADRRLIRIARKIEEKKLQPFTTFSSSRREQIMNDVPSTSGIKSLDDIKSQHRVFYNPRSGEIQCVLFDTNTDAYRFYSMYYSMTPGIIEATGAAFKRLVARNTHVFTFKGEGLKWGTLADISLWLNAPESRIKFDGDPADYDVIERSYAFQPLYRGRPFNLDFSRVMLAIARMTPVAPSLIERLG